MTFQHVQMITKDGNVSIDEFFINGKSLLTPSVFLGIRSNYSKRIDIDMNVAIKTMDYTSKTDSFSGIYFPLESWRSIHRRLTVEQRMFLMGPSFEERFLLLPSVELLYYGLIKKIKNHLDLIKSNYPNIEGYYNSYRDTLKGNRASTKSYHKWLPSLNAKLNDYVFDFLRFQYNQKTLFFIPPTPPIFDLNIGLNYAESVFQISKQFLSSIYVEEKDEFEEKNIEPISLYLPLSTLAFKNIDTVKTAMDKLKRILKNLKPDIILLKFFDDSSYNSISKQNLKGIEYFSRCIIEYCKSNNKLSGVMDAKDIGKILLFKGINFIGTPINRRASLTQPGGRGGPPPPDEWPIVDPSIREEITFSNYKKKYCSRSGTSSASGSLPYLNDLNSLYNRRTLLNLSKMEQTEFTKLSPLILTANDIAELKEAIISGTSRAIIGRYGAGTSSYALKIRILLNE